MTIDIVVKIGGGLLAHPGDLDRVMKLVQAASKETRLVIVPGGGPFADVVRAVDRRFQLSDSAAHWMAILAMDQTAHVFAARMPNAEVVTSPEEIGSSLLAGRLPILAPSQWLEAADPLPHSWAVTSDSIAAWIAGALGSKKLVLIKPPFASGDRLVDEYFDQVRPAIESSVVTADNGDAVRSALRTTIPAI